MKDSARIRESAAALGEFSLRSCAQHLSTPKGLKMIDGIGVTRCRSKAYSQLSIFGAGLVSKMRQTRDR
jgi:hypothetical protein